MIINRDVPIKIDSYHQSTNYGAINHINSFANKIKFFLKKESENKKVDICTCYDLDEYIDSLKSSFSYAVHNNKLFYLSNNLSKIDINVLLHLFAGNFRCGFTYNFKDVLWSFRGSDFAYSYVVQSYYDYKEKTKYLKLLNVRPIARYMFVYPIFALLSLICGETNNILLGLSSIFSLIGLINSYHNSKLSSLYRELC